MGRNAVTKSTHSEPTRTHEPQAGADTVSSVIMVRVVGDSRHPALVSRSLPGGLAGKKAKIFAFAT